MANKTSGVSRDVALQRTAELRALIIAQINLHPTHGISTAYLFHSLEADCYSRGVDKLYVSKLVSDLGRQGLVVKSERKDAEGHALWFPFRPKKLSTPKVNPEVAAGTLAWPAVSNVRDRKPVAASEEQPAKAATVLINVSRSTGRTQVIVNGVTIDIGIVD